MSARSVKKQVLGLLAQEDLPTLLNGMAALSAFDVINSLFSAICRGEEIIRWHAISCMGPTVFRIASADIEKARIIMRRFLWNLNDESGGIGWGSPESFAEVMFYHDGLAKEYIHMLISYTRGDGEEIFQSGNFLEHEWLQRGLLWGINRLTEKRRNMLIPLDIETDINAYLGSPDSIVRGLAVSVLGRLGLSVSKRYEEALLEDMGPVRFYQDGMFYDLTVAQIMQKTRAAENISAGV